MDIKIKMALFIPLLIAFNDLYAASQTIDPLNVLKTCDNKYLGEDQVSNLAVTVVNRSGNRRHTIYKRIWKNLAGASKEQLDKMTLFAISPPDARNTAFMRYSFTSNSGKNAEQWIYLPSLRKIKRVSIRDLGDSFLGTDLTYGDITLRTPAEDQHEILRAETAENGNTVFMIASHPKEPDSIYSKKISTFVVDKSSQICLKRHISYFDRKGALLKEQAIDWQQINKAWLWRKVEVINAQTFSKSIFEVSQVKVNVGISNQWFTERMLKRGIN